MKNMGEAHLVLMHFTQALKQNLMKDMGETHLVLECDKNTNSEGKKKELQIRVCFWSPLSDKVVGHHLVRYFMVKTL